MVFVVVVSTVVAAVAAVIAVRAAAAVCIRNVEPANEQRRTAAVVASGYGGGERAIGVVGVDDARCKGELLPERVVLCCVSCVMSVCCSFTVPSFVSLREQNGDLTCPTLRAARAKAAAGGVVGAYIYVYALRGCVSSATREVRKSAQARAGSPLKKPTLVLS